MTSCAQFLLDKSKPKITIVGSKVMDTKQYYLSMYRMQLVNLYDLCYISDPTRLIESEIYDTYIFLNIDKVKDRYGKYHIDHDYIAYALDWYKANAEEDEEGYEDIIEFLTLLERAVYYRDIFHNLDLFWEDQHLKPTLKKRINLRMISRLGRIKVRSPWNIDEGILKCFYTFASSFNLISVNKILYDLANNELGTSQAEWIRNFTPEQMQRHLKLILSGQVELDGRDSADLQNWLDRQSMEDDILGYQQEGLYNWLYNHRYSEIIAEMDNLCTQLLTKHGDSIVAACEDGFYCKVSRPIELPVGQFAFICHERDIAGMSQAVRYHGVDQYYTEYLEEQLPDVNCILGYTGQVYPVSYMENNKLQYTGCPIRLYNEYHDLLEFIDFENTELVCTESVFQTIGGELEWDIDAEERELKVAGKTTNFDKQLFYGYRNMDKGVRSITIPNPEKVQPRVSLDYDLIRQSISKIKPEVSEDETDMQM